LVGNKQLQLSRQNGAFMVYVAEAGTRVSKNAFHTLKSADRFIAGEIRLAAIRAAVEALGIEP
jgi:hypothetical protein